MKKPFNLYAYAHKQHHEHIHSVSITAEDVHWIEFYLTNIGILAGPMLLGDKMHYWTFSMWGLCRMVQA
jgi:sterol desaturase/sphingolipid hydroxylase (fatty acid hydroxylase superfamily)